MHHTHDPGTINRTEGAPAANKLFVPEPTVKYNAGIQYNRLIHRRCASLDLETMFKEIKISQNIEKEVCKQCQAEFCRCPAFTSGTPCSSVSSTPTSTSDEQIPKLVVDKCDRLKALKGALFRSTLLTRLQTRVCGFSSPEALQTRVST